MPELPLRPTHAEAEAHFRDLLKREGFAQPDEVRHWGDPDEVVFMWHEPKVAIVIELGPEGPKAVRSTAASGDPPV